jgi:hypothetical protein
MRVEGDRAADQEVQPGDLLVVDRSQPAQEGSLVVAAIAGALQVLRLHKHHGQLVPATDWVPGQTLDMERGHPLDPHGLAIKNPTVASGVIRSVEVVVVQEES